MREVNKERGQQPKKIKKNSIFSRLLKIWGTIFFLIMVTFLGVLVHFNILPNKALLAVVGGFIVLGLLLLPPLLSYRFKIGRRIIAFFLSLIVSVALVIGISYISGTISFMSNISALDGKNLGLAKPVDVNKDSYNILISGIDSPGKIDVEGRSDVNMIVTVNPKTHKVLLTSIPRDYRIRLVDMGYATDKLTHTGVFGIDQTIKSVEDLLDLDINYYVKVNFTTVQKFIDAVGGVDIESKEKVRLSVDENGIETADAMDINKGMNHLNGAQALTFARERNAYKDGDIQRNQNQQLVLTAILEKATSSKELLFKYATVLSELADYVETNMSKAEMQALIKGQISNLKGWDISRQHLEGVGNMAPLYSTGGAEAYVMEDDVDSIADAKRGIDKIFN